MNDPNNFSFVDMTCSVPALSSEASLPEAALSGFYDWLARLSERAEAPSGCWVLADSQGKLLAAEGGAPAGELRERSAADDGSRDELAAFFRRFASHAFGVAGDFPFGEYRACGVPVQLRADNAPTALVFIAPPEVVSAIADRIGLLAFALEACCREAVKREEARKQSLLYEAAAQLHAKIDVDSVLSETLSFIRRVYPFADVELYLSQDRTSQLPVKLLNFQNIADDPCTQAFMSGKTVVQAGEDGAQPVVAVPLRGPQGVYGVMRLEFGSPPDADDLRLVASLADTAGSAFENARLYEQSNMLIHELQVINEITKRLTQSLKLSDIYQFASNELIHIFGAEFCCILELDTASRRMIVQASNLPAMFNEHFSIDYGFAGMVYKTQEPIIISDYTRNPKVKSKLMEITGSRSLIASPIIVGSEVRGAILVAHRIPNFFSYDNFKLLQVLSGHIGLAMSNASLHAEVRRMAVTDHLTGLYVRRYLDEQIAMQQRKDLCGTLVLIDVDNFKMINDTYGHQVGDRVLIQISSVIRSCIRETDIPVRWGGEELAVYLPQVRVDQALRVADRIRTQVAQVTDPRVTISCGLADWSKESERQAVEALFQRADVALYQAKEAGKNNIQIAR
ncbi:sensor domain-containing diguanylate cyclase [Paenibacillus thermoaerophilus]|uniref:Sensor domain-containing diguanylate cyclase n=1 Tax=Paenibacillus thermoaerophilus TaxID=1215385 RepID=A0ABW2V1S8_9BACL|nr:diguanylate cyclase [Paenibacillus thermoaerophilus]TMV19117.1 diguanylate cyclase [Paenibacillus thermoaerophilus]